MTAGSPPDTIVAVHGFWVTPRSWRDHIMSPSIQKSHEGWEQIADDVLEWAVHHAR